MTYRTTPYIDASEIKSKDSALYGINGNVLIRYIAIPETEFTWYITSPIKDEVLNTKLFKEVEIKKYESPYNKEELTKINNKEFDLRIKSIKLFPMEDISKYDFVIDYMIRPIYQNRYPEQMFDSVRYTFGMYPIPRDFSYEVLIEIHKRDEQKAYYAQFVEQYSSQMSTFPHEGTHFQITWEKEPLVNLIKFALREFKNKNILK